MNMLFYSIFRTNRFDDVQNSESEMNDERDKFLPQKTEKVDKAGRIL